MNAPTVVLKPKRGGGKARPGIPIYKLSGEKIHLFQEEEEESATSPIPEDISLAGRKNRFFTVAEVLAKLHAFLSVEQGEYVALGALSLVYVPEGGNSEENDPLSPALGEDFSLGGRGGITIRRGHDVVRH